MTRTEPPYCYHEDEDTGYRMNVVENGIETTYGTNQLRKAELYECTHPDCDNQVLSDFGQPIDFSGITEAIELIYDKD